MPDIRDKDYNIEYYYTDPCTKRSQCVQKETVLKFEDFDPVYAPVFVDMLVTGHKTLKNVLMQDLEKRGDYQYVIHLKYPMEIGTIIGSNKLARRYWLAEYKGRSKKGAHTYRLKSVEEVSVNEVDESVLKKETVVFKKGQFKNVICK